MPKQFRKLLNKSPLVKFINEDKQKTENKLREIERESRESMLPSELARAISHRVMAYHAENNFAPKVASAIFLGGRDA